MCLLGSVFLWIVNATFTTTLVNKTMSFLKECSPTSQQGSFLLGLVALLLPLRTHYYGKTLQGEFKKTTTTTPTKQYVNSFQ